MLISSAKAAAKQAKELTKVTGQKHIVRPCAVGNKIAYKIINIERFST